MAKQHKQDGIHIVEEAHHGSMDPLNPYYWLNRIPRGGPLRITHSRKATFIFLLICPILLCFMFWSLPSISRTGSFTEIIIWLLLLACLLSLEIASLAELLLSPKSKAETANQKEHEPKRRKDYQ